MEFRSRSRRRPQINIMPLIDVLLIVLIFFVVNSTFVDQPAVPIDLPRASSGEVGRLSPATVTVSRTGDVWFGGAQVSLDELRGALTTLKAEAGEVPLVLKADRLVAYERVLQVMRVSQEAGFRKIVAPIEAEEAPG